MWADFQFFQNLKTKVNQKLIKIESTSWIAKEQTILETPRSASLTFIIFLMSHASFNMAIFGE